MARRGGWRVCTVPGCPEYSAGGGKCDSHRAEAEQRRGTARQRGYGGRQWTEARTAVLRRDPFCVCTDTDHGHADPCRQPATVADHYPDERRDLVAAGVADPDALHRLRGVCAPCHGRKGAAETPYGWNQRD